MENQDMESAVASVHSIYSNITKISGQLIRRIEDGESSADEQTKEALRTLGSALSALSAIMGNRLTGDYWTSFYRDLEGGYLPEDFRDTMQTWRYYAKIWILTADDAVGRCPLCGNSVRYLPDNGQLSAQQKDFGFPYWNACVESFGREKAVCPVCGGTDRERMISLFIKTLRPEGGAGAKLKVLHIAPTKALETWLLSVPDIDCESADALTPEICGIPDETYDLVICSYVLQRVRDDRSALRELKRIVKADGACLFLVPLVTGLNKTDEASGLSAQESWKRFGGGGVSRLYGKEDFLNRLTEAGFLVHILDKGYLGESEWKASGLTDNHCLYAATRTDIGIGVSPYAPLPDSQRQEPLVSVIIPAYNRGYCISRAISSVLNQTYRNLELFVIDDGSDDDTAQRVEAFHDNRLKYVRLKNQGGANHARNVGIQMAAGSYVAFNDSDDEWLPDKLRKQMALFRLEERIHGNRAGGVYCWFTRYSGDSVDSVMPGEWLKPDFLVGNIYDYMLHNFFLSTQTVVLRKSVLDDVGGFNENLKRLQDWELFLRIAKKYTFSPVQESLVKVNLSGDCISKNNKAYVDTFLYVKDLHMLKNDIITWNLFWIHIINYLNVHFFPDDYKRSVAEHFSRDGLLSRQQIANMYSALGIAEDG